MSEDSKPGTRTILAQASRRRQGQNTLCWVSSSRSITLKACGILCHMIYSCMNIPLIFCNKWEERGRSKNDSPTLDHPDNTPNAPESRYIISFNLLQAERFVREKVQYF